MNFIKEYVDWLDNQREEATEDIPNDNVPGVWPESEIFEELDEEHLAEIMKSCDLPVQLSTNIAVALNNVNPEDEAGSMAGLLDDGLDDLLIGCMEPTLENNVSRPNRLEKCKLINCKFFGIHKYQVNNK